MLSHTSNLFIFALLKTQQHQYHRFLDDNPAMETDSDSFSDRELPLSKAAEEHQIAKPQTLK
jgi:hypothetical protein